MNFDAQRESQSTPEALPRPSLKITLFSILALFVGVAALPLCTNEWICIASLAVLFLYVAVVLRLPSAVSLLLVSTFCIVVFTASFASGAIFLGLIVSVGAAALLLNTSKYPFAVPLVHLLAAVSVFFVTHSPVLSLTVFATLPAAFLLAIFVKRDASRTSAICAAEAGLLLVLIGVIAYFLMGECQRLGVSVNEYIDLLRADAVALLREGKQMLLESLLEIETADEKELLAAFAKIDDATMRAAVDQVINILPAMICIVCSIVAYEAHLFLGVAYRAIGWQKAMSPEARVFTMSIPAALLFFVSFILSFFSNGAMIFAVADNLKLILFPGFCLVGMGSLSRSLRQAKGGMRTALMLGAVAMLCCSVGGALSLLSLFGAQQVIFSAMEKKLYQKLVSMGAIDPNEDPNADPSQEEDENNDGDNDSQDGDDRQL